MPATTGAHAPDVSLCPHLLDTGLQSPMALYHTKRQARYGCPACTASAIQRRLDQPGQEPSDAAASVSFRHCEHSSGERACWPCLEATCAELIARWAKLFYSDTDKPAANRLRRVVAHWRGHYDPLDLKRQTAPRATECAAPPVESKEQRRERLARERIEKRNAAIRQQRRLPEHGTLQMQGQRRESIVVVPAGA